MPIHQSTIAVSVTTGESLTHRVTLVAGAGATFALVNKLGSSVVGEILMTQADPQSAAFVWERNWPQNGDTVAGDQRHAIEVNFAIAQTYRYEVIFTDDLGNATTIIDQNFDRESSGLFDGNSLHVLTS